MQTRTDAAVRVLAVAIAVVGAWLMLQSTELGMGAADGLLQRQGGGMDTTLFAGVRQGYMESYRWMGALLLGIGGIFAVRR